MSPDDIVGMLRDRREHYRDRNQRVSDLIRVKNGLLHELYPDSFPERDVPITLNLIEIAWTSYSSMVGKVPDKTVRPIGVSDRAQARASLIESIVHGYDEDDRMKALAYMHAFWLVGTGSAVMGVVPDFKAQRPRFCVEDIRNVYPTPGYESVFSASAGDAVVSTGVNPDNVDVRSLRHGLREGEPWYAGDLEDILLERLCTIGALKSQFPDVAGLLGDDTPNNLRTQVRVVQYWDRHELTLVAVHQKRNIPLTRARHDLGFVPYRITQNYAPDQQGGMSQFEQQVGPLLALSRLWNQKLAANDNTAWPKTWVKGNVTSARLGPWEMLQLDQQAEIGQLPTASEFQTDRDIQALTTTIRALNRDGGAQGGDVQGGPITGRGIEALARPGDTIVHNYWNLTSPDLAALYGYALAIDEHFWPDLEKTFHGMRDGEEFEGSYIPRRDIAGHRAVMVTYGFGVGGADGFLQALQAQSAGLMAEETVMQQMPGVRSVASERRRIMIDRVEKAIFQAFEQGNIPQAQFLGKIRDELQTGSTLSEALQKLPAPPAPGLTPPSTVPGVPGVPGAVTGPEAAAAALGGAAPQAPPDLAGLLSGALGGGK